MTFTNHVRIRLPHFSSPELAYTVTQPTFTVFTPTFNRAHTLPRVYESLCRQSFKDFEWLIVDDGSTDETEKLVAKWTSENEITLRYIRQSNSGKHIAFNKGVAAARGRLFLPLDSDDTCVPKALEVLWRQWESIPEDQRQKFTGITCLCTGAKDSIVGGALPAEIIDGRFYKVVADLKRTGEMWGFHRTDVLRAFPFPSIAGERFVPEGLVWNRIAQQYLMRFINVALRQYFDSEDSLSRKMTKIRIQSPVATMTYYGESLNLAEMPFLFRLRAALNLWRFAWLSNRLIYAKKFFSYAPFLLAVALVPGIVIALFFKHDT